MTLDTILKKYKNWYQYMHENTDYFHGFSLKLFIPNITFLIENSNIRTALDYGCGKAVLHTKYSLQEYWGLDKLDKYDPGVKEWCEPPIIKYDLIFCIDVMEHIEENDIDAVLQHIYELTDKVAFFSISTRLAKKNLPDGTNAHKTIRPNQWWHDKIDNIFKDKLVIINFSI